MCVGISFVASTQFVFAHSPCWCSFSALTTFNQSGISFRIFSLVPHTHTLRPDSSLPFGLFLFICNIDHRFKEAKVFSIFHLFISNSVRFDIEIIIAKKCVRDYIFVCSWKKFHSSLLFGVVIVLHVSDLEKMMMKKKKTSKKKHIEKFNWSIDFFFLFLSFSLQISIVFILKSLRLKEV